MKRRHIEILGGLVVVGVAALITFVLGLWGYMSFTSTPLHPDVNTVSTVASKAPEGKWSAAADQARQVVRAAVADQNLPGMSVAVGSGGDIVWAEGFGWANIEQKTPVTPATSFRLGTLSTVLTSAAAGLLIEEDRLKLDAPVRGYAPDTPEHYGDVTVRQVMAGIAGLPVDGGDENPLLRKQCDGPGDGLKALGGFQREREHEPGNRFAYSTYGWLAMSAAIEQAAGQPYQRFMRARIFEPLGLTGTDADFKGAPAPHQATSYFPRFMANPRYNPDVMGSIDLSCYAGGSIFVSTPSDLARFAMALNAGKLLQPATVQLLQTSQKLASGQETAYGLGWKLESVTLGGKPTRAIGHNGDLIGGQLGSLWSFPDRGVTVAVMSNISYADTFAVAVKVADAFAR